MAPAIKKVIKAAEILIEALCDRHAARHRLRRIPYTYGHTWPARASAEIAIFLIGRRYGRERDKAAQS